MNADPKRWLSEDSDASPLERALLESVRDVRPPAHAKEQAWRGISVIVAAGAAGTAASSIAPAAAAASTKVGAGAVAAGKALLVKAAWTLAAGSIAVGGYLVSQRALPSAPEPVERAARIEAPAPAPARVPAVEPIAAEEPQPALEDAPARSVAKKRKDLLTAESARLARARAALRGGDAAGAQRMLQRMDADFPRGVLEQEREVLAIEVLAARGQRAAARQRARAFAKAYPQSPHTTQLRSLLDAP